MTPTTPADLADLERNETEAASVEAERRFDSFDEAAMEGVACEAFEAGAKWQRERSAARQMPVLEAEVKRLTKDRDALFAGNCQLKETIAVMRAALPASAQAKPAAWRPDLNLLDQLRPCIGKASLPTLENGGKTSRLHLWSMLDRMEAFTSVGKFNRWIGYIQGVLVATGNGTVDQFKDMNRAAPPPPAAKE